MVTLGGRKALRRVLWWLGLSVLIILARAVGASGEPIESADTAQLADMCTRLASGIPLTMTTPATGENEAGTTENEVASAQTTWAAPEADYTSIMQHALSGFGGPAQKPSRADVNAVEPAPMPEPAPPFAEPEVVQAPVASESREPGMKVAAAAILPTVWIAAFGAPGLLAIVVSVFGIIINRPERED